MILDWLYAHSFNERDAVIGASTSDLRIQPPHGAPPEATTVVTLAGSHAGAGIPSRGVAMLARATITDFEEVDELCADLALGS